MDYLADIYSRHAALALEKQLALGRIIGTRGFSFNADAGTLSFVGGLPFPMQLLGTVSRQSNTWRWAWAKVPPVRPALLQAAHQLRALGERLAIDELVEEEFDLVTPTVAELALAADPEFAPTPLDGHYLAMLAVGVCQASAYYGADYGQGVAYVLLPQIPAVEAQLSVDPAKMASVFAQLVQMPYVLDHRAAFTHYLQAKDYFLKQDGTQVQGQKNGRQLSATFDAANRLRTLAADGAAIVG
jgi:hypothetical protein